MRKTYLGNCCIFTDNENVTRWEIFIRLLSLWAKIWYDFGACKSNLKPNTASILNLISISSLLFRIKPVIWFGPVGFPAILFCRPLLTKAVFYWTKPLTLKSTSLSELFYPPGMALYLAVEVHIPGFEKHSFDPHWFSLLLTAIKIELLWWGEGWIGYGNNPVPPMSSISIQVLFNPKTSSES